MFSLWLHHYFRRQFFWLKVTNDEGLLHQICHKGLFEDPGRKYFCQIDENWCYNKTLKVLNIIPNTFVLEFSSLIRYNFQWRSISTNPSIKYCRCSCKSFFMGYGTSSTYLVNASVIHKIYFFAFPLIFNGANKSQYIY